MTQLTAELLDQVDLSDITSTASQVMLRAVRDAIVAGKLKAPPDSDIPSPQLAARLQKYRTEFDCNVYVLGSARDSISCLIEPRDGLPLFFLRFDAMHSIQSGPAQ